MQDERLSYESVGPIVKPVGLLGVRVFRRTRNLLQVKGILKTKKPTIMYVPYGLHIIGRKKP